jgi:hypothetical protein
MVDENENFDEDGDNVDGIIGQKNSRLIQHI